MDATRAASVCRAAAHSSGTDQQIGASFDRFERAISAVLILASSSEAHF